MFRKETKRYVGLSFRQNPLSSMLDQVWRKNLPFCQMLSKGLAQSFRSHSTEPSPVTACSLSKKMSILQLIPNMFQASRFRKICSGIKVLRTHMDKTLQETKPWQGTRVTTCDFWEMQALSSINSKQLVTRTLVGLKSKLKTGTQHELDN